MDSFGCVFAIIEEKNWNHVRFLTMIEQKIGIMCVCFDNYRGTKLESCAFVLTIIEQQNWNYESKKIGIMCVYFDQYRDHI